MAIAVQSHAINSYQSQLHRAQASEALGVADVESADSNDVVKLSGLAKLFEHVAEKFDVQRMARRDRTALASELFSLGVIDHSAHRMLASIGSAQAGEINLSTTVGQAAEVLPFSQQHVAGKLLVVTQNLLAARSPMQ